MLELVGFWEAAVRFIIISVFPTVPVTCEYWAGSGSLPVSRSSTVSWMRRWAGRLMFAEETSPVGVTTQNWGAVVVEFHALLGVITSVSS